MFHSDNDYLGFLPRITLPQVALIFVIAKASGISVVVVAALTVLFLKVNHLEKVVAEIQDKNS